MTVAPPPLDTRCTADTYWGSWIAKTSSNVAGRKPVTSATWHRPQPGSASKYGVYMQCSIYTSHAVARPGPPLTGQGCRALMSMQAQPQAGRGYGGRAEVPHLAWPRCRQQPARLYGRQDGRHPRRALLVTRKVMLCCSRRRKHQLRGFRRQASGVEQCCTWAEARAARRCSSGRPACSSTEQPGPG